MGVVTVESLCGGANRAGSPFPFRILWVFGSGSETMGVSSEGWGGRLEVAQQMAAPESARTTGLYDRRSDEFTIDEVERIGV